MTRSTTATISVSPKHVGIWADQDLWRIAGLGQIVEGNTPYWIVTPTQPAQYAVADKAVSIETPDPEIVLDSILIWLSVWFGGEVEEARLLESHNIAIDGGQRLLAPNWELADSTKANLAKGMAQKVRLAVTILDDTSLVNEQVVEGLRNFGFDVAVFAESAFSAQRQSGA